MPDTDFLTTLSIERRLALSYAPRWAKRLWLGLFALDARLDTTVRNSAEPVLTQIKLAWWRDELAKPQSQRRRGEPLLELLDAWGDDAGHLAALVDGRELLLGDLPLGCDAAEQFAEERARACLGLADRLTIARDGVAQAARDWAFADLDGLLANSAGRGWHRIKLPREMRPLLVLHGLAVRNRGKGPLIPGPIAGMHALRLGLFGI